jgi:hypothetical protein
MTSARPQGFGGYTPGHWRADAPGKPVPEPPKPEVERPEAVALGKVRDPRTAENMRAHEDALAPRRYRPAR